jgi:transcription antitermination factor NusA-like protein
MANNYKDGGFKMIDLIDWRVALRSFVKVIVAVMVVFSILIDDNESAFLYTLIIIAIELGNVVFTLKAQNGIK